MDRLSALALVCVASLGVAQAETLAPERIHRVQVVEDIFPALGAPDSADTIVVDACMLGPGRAQPAQLALLLQATARHPDLRVRPFACAPPRPFSDAAVRLALWAADQRLFAAAMPLLAEIDGAPSPRELTRIASRLGLVAADWTRTLDDYAAGSQRAFAAQRAMRMSPGEIAIAGQRFGFGSAEHFDNALAAHRAARARPAANANIEHVHLPDLSRAASRGSDSAPLTLVFFGDLSSPPSARVAEKISALPKHLRDALRVVWIPLVSARESPRYRESVEAAELALAAHEQGCFWRVHDRLVQHVARDNPQEPGTLVALAASAGLDASRFASARKSGRYSRQLASLAKTAAVAPALFLLRESLVHIYPSAIEQMLAEELDRSALERFHLPHTK